MRALGPHALPTLRPYKKYLAGRSVARFRHGEMRAGGCYGLKSKIEGEESILAEAATVCGDACTLWLPHICR